MTSTRPAIRTADDPTEMLLFCTIRIVAEQSSGASSVGTGFFFSFAESDDGGEVPAIVTNKHVIGDAQQVTLTFRESLDDLSGPQHGKSIRVTIADAQKSIIRHPDDDVDLCAIPLAKLIAHLNREGATPWFGMLDMEALNLPPGPPRAIENVLMVGYPTGLWDDFNDMPITRRGITATHPGLNWRGRPEFLIDAACFPGSSGSPVFMVRTTALAEPLPGGFDHKAHMPLIGILYAGPQYHADGVITVRDVPTAVQPVPSTAIPMNLGFVIKAEKLNDIDTLIRERISSGTFAHLAQRSRTGSNDDAAHVPSFLWKRA